MWGHTPLIATCARWKRGFFPARVLRLLVVEIGAGFGESAARWTSCYDPASFDVSMELACQDHVGIHVERVIWRPLPTKLPE